jgi:choline dehydrogenase-like flavoprotein
MTPTRITGLSLRLVIVIPGVRFIEKLLTTDVVKKLGGQLRHHLVPFPACKDHAVNTDAYWKCYLPYTTVTLHHPVGTCKMGAESDPTSVVDASLR